MEDVDNSMFELYYAFLLLESNHVEILIYLIIAEYLSICHQLLLLLNNYFQDFQ